MKHRPRPEEQDDLLRPRLVDMIDPRHELVKLSALIDWEVFEREWSGFFPSGKGRPATEPRLVAGLLYLQHAYRLSDEAVVARWVDGPRAVYILSICVPIGLLVYLTFAWFTMRDRFHLLLTYVRGQPESAVPAEAAKI